MEGIMNKLILLSIFLLQSCLQTSKSAPNSIPPRNDYITANHQFIYKVERSDYIEQCANSGAYILSGMDSNDNGILESTEISGKEYLCDGSNGTNGSNGKDGQDGINSLLRFSRLEDITECGTAGVVIVSGKDINKNNILEAAEIEQTSYICDGNTEAVESPVIKFIDPCGDSSSYDEVILRMSSGELVAYFEDGSRRFLSILSPGVYQTTDAQKCIFKVTNDMEVVW
jgi:hypothetical protein